MSRRRWHGLRRRGSCRILMRRPGGPPGRITVTDGTTCRGRTDPGVNTQTQSLTARRVGGGLIPAWTHKHSHWRSYDVYRADPHVNTQTQSLTVVWRLQSWSRREHTTTVTDGRMTSTELIPAWTHKHSHWRSYDVYRADPGVNTQTQSLTVVWRLQSWSRREHTNTVTDGRMTSTELIPTWTHKHSHWRSYEVYRADPDVNTQTQSLTVVWRLQSWSRREHTNTVTDGRMRSTELIPTWTHKHSHWRSYDVYIADPDVNT